jgi:micrococcal nuclease
MKFIVALLLVLLIGTNSYWWSREHEQYRVTSVYDGDTFWLKSGDRVRLLGINAPELDKCLGQEAKQKLSDLVLNKIVDLREEKRDEYGRRMGLVYVGDKLVNIELARQGLAKLNYDPNSKSEEIKAAGHQAVQDKLGVFGSECKKTVANDANPNCKIKGNIDKGTGVRLYHLPTCRHYKNVILDLDTDENYFCTEKEAQEAGFHLAPDCLR